MHADIRELLEAFFKEHSEIEAVRWYQSPEEGTSNVYAKPDSDEDNLFECCAGDYEDGFFSPFNVGHENPLYSALVTLSWNVESVLEGTITIPEMVEVSADLVEHREPYTVERMTYEDEEGTWAD